MTFQRTESSRDLTKPVNYKLKRFEVTAKTREGLDKRINDGELTIHSPDKKYIGLADDNHRIAFIKHMNDKEKIHGNKGELDPETSVFKTPERFDNLGLQYDNATTPPPNVYAVNPNQEYDETDVFKRLAQNNTKNGTPIKSIKSGGKSKRRKSKTKSCCSVRKSAKVCRRKTDNKKFRLPRRFSRKTCLAKKPRGFTMRSSCAPYKGCKKTRKGGTRKKGKRKKEGPSDDDIFHLYDNPVSANFMSKLLENTDHLSDKDAGIYRENMEKEMIKKVKKLISNLSVEQEDMLLKLSKKIEEESRGGRKK